MDILNWFSWTKQNRVVSSVSDNALIAVGEPDPNRDDKYLTVAVKRSDLLPTIPRFPNYENDAAVNAVVGTPLKGQMYFDTTDNKAKVYDGSSWVSIF